MKKVKLIIILIICVSQMLASQNNSLLKWLNVYMLLMSMCPKLEATSTIKDNDIHVWHAKYIQLNMQIFFFYLNRI